MLKFSRKEGGKRKRNGGKGKRRDRKEGGREEKKEGEKCKRTEWGGILGKKKKVCAKK